MTIPRWLDSAPVHLAILRAAELLVPGSRRVDWFAEWRAELLYVKQSRTIFCLGAFWDALWLRRNSPSPNARRTFGLESPFRCVLFLAALALLSLFFAFRLPFARDMLLPSPYRDPANLVMISADGQFRAQIPTVSIAQYRSLANRMQSVFTGLAFYLPTQTRVQTAGFSVALASRNLFDLLQIPVTSHDAGRIVDPEQPSLAQVLQRRSRTGRPGDSSGRATDPGRRSDFSEFLAPPGPGRCVAAPGPATPHSTATRLQRIRARPSPRSLQLPTGHLRAQ
jgi:hypothetical protein